jgi:hypothetical protein
VCIVPDLGKLALSRLPFSKLTTFNCERENMRGITGCDSKERKTPLQKVDTPRN